MKEQFEHVFDFETFRLDTRKHKLLCDGQVVPLTSKAIFVLSMLVNRSGDLVTKKELIESVWSETFVEENNLNQQITAIRKALGEKKDLIVTYPKVGYSFIGAVKSGYYDEIDLVLEESSRSSITIDISHDEKPQNYQSIRQNNETLAFRVKSLLLSLVALAYLLVFGSIFYSIYFPTRTIIAVLPFKSFGKSNVDEDLTNGISETLTAKIGNLKSLTVRPFNSSADYLGQEQNLVELGRKLNANTILAGSVQREGERLRISIQVYDAVNNRVDSGNVFYQDVVDSFTLQDTISEEIAAALQVKYSN